MDDQNGDDEHGPVCNRGSDTGAHAPHSWKAPESINEQRIQAYVHRQGNQRDHHGNFSLPERINKTAQYGIREQRNDADRDGGEKLGGNPPNFRLQAHSSENARYNGIPDRKDDDGK